MMMSPPTPCMVAISRPVHSYWAFGLHIASDIELPEFVPTTFERADIKILLETNTVADGRWKYDFERERMIHRVPGVATYHARSGEDAIVQVDPGADPRAVRLHLLSVVMPAMLAQRGFIALHASAVVLGSQLVVIAGDSGAGKSTTATTLAERGARIFTDDVCVLRGAADRSYGVSAYPVVKLLDDSGVKHHHYIHRQFVTDPYPIAAVVILEIDNHIETAVIREISGAEAFKQLEPKIYWRQLIVSIEMRKHLFTSIATLLKGSRVFALHRPAGHQTAPDVARLIESL